MSKCSDYENRPQVCRDFTCGKPCEHCGRCCHDVLFTLPPGMETVVTDDNFFALHGIRIEDGLLFMECRCKNLIDDEDSKDPTRAAGSFRPKSG